MSSNYNPTNELSTTGVRVLVIKSPCERATSEYMRLLEEVLDANHGIADGYVGGYLVESMLCDDF